MTESCTQAASRASRRAAAISSASLREPAVVLTTMASTMASGPVVAVDLDVALGEVAGPHRRRSPTDADVDADLQLGVLHVAAHRRLVVGRRHLPVARRPQVAEAHAHPLAVDRLVGPAD